MAEEQEFNLVNSVPVNQKYIEFLKLCFSFTTHVSIVGCAGLDLLNKHATDYTASARVCHGALLVLKLYSDKYNQDLQPEINLRCFEFNLSSICLCLEWKNYVGI